MHVSTQEEARGSLSHPEETHFRLVARDEGSFPCFVGKEFPAFPSNLKRRRSPQERRGELQGPATIPRVPQISQSIPEEAVFPALPRLSCRGSTHNTVARGRALWESLLGKPPGKATDPLSHMTGSVTLQLQLGRKVHVHAPTRDEDWLPCGDSRITPRSMSAQENNPQVPARLNTRTKDAASKGEESREAPEQLPWGLTFPEAARAGRWGPRRNSRAPAATRENPEGSRHQGRWGPFPLRRLEANHIWPVEIRKGPSHPCCNSRSSPTYPTPLERKHRGPAHIQRSPVSAS